MSGPDATEASDGVFGAQLCLTIKPFSFHGKADLGSLARMSEGYYWTLERFLFALPVMCMCMCMRQSVSQLVILHSLVMADKIGFGIPQTRVQIWLTTQAPVVKNPLANAGRLKRGGFDPCVGKTPWRRAWQPILVSLPGESHGQRSLVGCRPQGRRVGHD